MGKIQEAYKKPPITEAVIEIKLLNPAPFGAVDRAKASILHNFSKTTPIKPQNFHIDNERGRIKVSSKTIGYRVEDESATNIRILQVDSFISSRLAPYCGWINFYSETIRDWDIYIKETRTEFISKIGMRYINRIDIPISDMELSDLRRYINFSYSWKEAPFSRLSAFNLHLEFEVGEPIYSVIVNFYPAPSPLKIFSSYVVDIDISKDFKNNLNRSQVGKVLGEMRQHKNSVFEAIVTDQAREIFNA